MLPWYTWALAKWPQFTPGKVKVTQSCLTLCDPMDYTMEFLGQNTGVGSLSLLQGIFPTQGLNPVLLHCWQILYQLSHKGSPRMLEWVAYPFSSGSSWPGNQTGVSCIAGGFFTNWVICMPCAQTDICAFWGGSPEPLVNVRVPRSVRREDYSHQAARRQALVVITKTREKQDLCVYKESGGQRLPGVQGWGAIWQAIYSRNRVFSPCTLRQKPHLESGERTLSWARGTERKAEGPGDMGVATQWQPGIVYNSCMFWQCRRSTVGKWYAKSCFKLCASVLAKSLQWCLTLSDRTVACQALLSMWFSRQYWSGMSCPPPGDLTNPGIQPVSPVALHCRQIFYHWATKEDKFWAVTVLMVVEYFCC